MLFLIATGEERPNMLEDKKDESYHLKFARYCASQANNILHNDYLNKITLNREFYKGRQWKNDEDLEAFFKDDTNQDRNRIKIVKNLIRPMVEQYRGNAIRMQVNAKVKSISPQAISRRETKLEEMYMYTRVANQEGNPFGPDLKKRLPIGDNESETQDMFNNLYVDRYVEKMNFLLEYVSELNKFQSKQVRVAEEMALSGIAIIKNYEYSGNQIFEIVESQNFFWDRSCREYNLTDAEYQGEITYLTPSEIFERAPNLTQDERKAIESYARQYSKQPLQNSGNNRNNTNDNYNMSGRVPIINAYWRDGEKYEYGYVKDQFGYPYLTKINFIEEGEDKPKYTDAELIKVDSIRAKKLFKGELKRDLFIDNLRFASFIPREILASQGSGNSEEKIKDVALDWGLVSYQETENLDFNNVQFPFKACCWGYLDGEVLSPVDDAINPQRFINRILSVAENQINNSKGAGIIYDKTMVDPQGGESEILRAMNQSKPVGINAKGRGIQNAVTQYDSSIKSGTMVMFNIVDAMKNSIQDVTGINEAIKGESTGSDQLVGVTQLMIQRGSLMQEPFYNSITEIFLQCYQSIATVGKRIYADNERELAIIAGDKGASILKITKDMKLEDFRCFVKRTNTDEALIVAGDQMLLQYLQLGLIDKSRYAMLVGRSTPDEISAALRSQSKEDTEIAKMQQKKDEQDAMAMEEQANMESEQAMNFQNEQIAREDIKDLSDKKHKTNDTIIKGMFGLAKQNPALQNKVLEETKNLQNNVV